MGWEHEAETIWKAQELYCVDRLSFNTVAKETGVAASTLKRWSDKYEWRQKREEIAQAEAEIRVNKIMARSVTVKALLAKPRADLAFAVSALENQALKEAEAARQGAIRLAQEQTAIITINTPADAAKALRTAVEQKLAILLTRPENVDLQAVQNIQKCLVLIAQMEAAQPDAENADVGISSNVVARIEAAMRGES